MLIGEPPRTKADLNFVLLGIPVRIHPLFWIVSLVLGASADSEPTFVAIWMIAVFLAILVHEFGHALVARSYGARPWITLYGMGGLASFNPVRRDTASSIAITIAGPAAGFLFAALIFALLHATGQSVSFHRGGAFGVYWDFVPFERIELNKFIEFLLFINVIWGVINLFPVYPLDGGQIARELFVQADTYGGIRKSLWLSIITAAGIGLFGYVRLGNFFMALMFGYLAYQNYLVLQSYGGGGYGGGFGGGYDGRNPW